MSFGGLQSTFHLAKKKNGGHFFYEKSRGGILSEEVNNLCNFFLCLIAGDCLFTTGVRCQNGVCLDHQCYCNDGYGGKGCSMPGNSFESRPTFYFWRKMRLTFFLNNLQMKTSASIDLATCSHNAPTRWAVSSARVSPATKATVSPVQVSSWT